MVDPFSPNSYLDAEPYLDCSVTNHDFIVKRFWHICGAYDLPNDKPLIAAKNPYLYKMIQHQTTIVFFGFILGIILIIRKYWSKIYKELVPKN